MNPKRVVLVVVIFLTIIGLGVKKFNLLLVQKVDVQSINAGCVDEQKINEQANLTGKNIFLIKEEEIKNNLIKKNLCVKDVKIEKKFPRNIQLAIEGRTPLVRLATFTPAQVLDLSNLDATPSSQAALLDWNFPNHSFQKYFLADETGFIFDEGERTDLPEVFLAAPNFFLGQQLDKDDFQKVQQVLTKLTSLDESVTQTKIEEGNFLVQADKKIVFSLNRDLFKQLGSLQLILQKAKIDDSVMETIDLRFDKPVVVYTPKKR